VPIYERTYRTYDGVVQRRARWWPIVEQELRILFTYRSFVVLVILGMGLFFLRVMQIITYDTLSSDPNHPLTMAARNLHVLEVNPQMFFDFIRMQAPIVFLMLIYAGSGMICDDFKNNLMEVYFSKPLSWKDYVLGKAMTLILLGFGMTVVPGLILVVLHNVLAPGWATVRETYILPWHILVFSSVLVLPCAFGVLASSSLFGSQRFAGIAVFIVVFGNLALGGLLADLLHMRNALIVALPVAINRIGEALFATGRRPVFDSHWGYSLLLVALVTLVCAIVVARKVRRAEMAQ
jgi:ABC-type transport system involved in multi-copper enzyme maturation permease subunit